VPHPKQKSGCATVTWHSVVVVIVVLVVVVVVAPAVIVTVFCPSCMKPDLQGIMFVMTKR